MGLGKWRHNTNECPSLGSFRESMGSKFFSWKDLKHLSLHSHSLWTQAKVPRGYITFCTLKVWVQSRRDSTISTIVSPITSNIIDFNSIKQGHFVGNGCLQKHLCSFWSSKSMQTIYSSHGLCWENNYNYSKCVYSAGHSGTCL